MLNNKIKITQKAVGDNNNQNVNIVVAPTEEEIYRLIQHLGETDKNVVICAFKDAVASVKQDNLIKPSKRIFNPSIEKLAQSTDESEIIDTFKSLLSSSMDKTKSKFIHPSYPDIIGQLTSDEVKILNLIFHNEDNVFPLINIRIKEKNSTHLGKMLYYNFSDIAYKICDVPDNVNRYLDNLERLKLIEISRESFADKSLYSNLKNHSFVQNLINKENPSGNPRYDKYEPTYDEKVFRLTEFGLNFMKCCSVEPKEYCFSL